MRYPVPVVLLFALYVCGCGRGSSSAFADTYPAGRVPAFDSMSDRQLLDAWLFADSFKARPDSSFARLNTALENHYPYIATGIAPGNGQVLALLADTNSGFVQFYRRDHLQWITAGRCPFDKDWYDELQVADLNFDGVNEVLLVSARNMNGNQWIKAYTYIPTADSMAYAGHFSTDYTLHRADTSIHEDYTGSLYMPTTKTLYQWRNHKLVPVKMAEIMPEEDKMGSSTYTLSYYENPTYDQDSLKLVFEKKYNTERGEKAGAYWDRFYELERKER